MAAMQANPFSGVKVAFALSEFPTEGPSLQQLDAYLDQNGPTLRQSGFGPAMRGENPPWLMAMSIAAEATELPALTESERRDAGPGEAA